LTVITHMAVGAAVGSFMESEGAAAVLGLVSHVPLDVMPHYEFQKLWVELTAVVLVFGGLLLAGMGATAIFWGALGAVVPDLENLAWRLGILPGRLKVFPGHSARFSRILPHGRALGPRHAFTQIALVVACVVIVALRMRAGAV
jgi:hypothetical protein